jgi:hypothetical protein
LARPAQNQHNRSLFIQSKKSTQAEHLRALLKDHEQQLVRMLYLNSITKSQYRKWLRSNHTNKLDPMAPVTDEDFQFMDTPTKKRHDIGYICKKLESWKLSVDEVENYLPKFHVVQAANHQTTIGELEYEKDGLAWHSDCQIHVRQERRRGGEHVCVRRLVLQFPNDGFFYVDESLLDLLARNKHNERHAKNCPDGWAYLNGVVWPKLAAFDTFAREWFGYDASKKLRKQIMYNDDANRMDICVLCTETNVAIDFVFEPGFPVPHVSAEFLFV